MPRQNRAAATYILSALQDNSAETIQSEETVQELFGAGIREQAPGNDEKFKFLLDSSERAYAPLLHHLRQPDLHGVHRRPFGSRIREKRRVK